MSFGSLDVATGLGGGIVDFQSSYSDGSTMNGIPVDLKPLTMSVDNTSNSNVTLESTGELTLNADTDGVTLSANGAVGICKCGGTSFTGQIFFRPLVNGTVCGQSSCVTICNFSALCLDVNYNVTFGTGTDLLSGDTLGIRLELSSVDNRIYYCDVAGS